MEKQEEEQVGVTLALFICNGGSSGPTQDIPE
jgi:hypothetical protein